MLSMVKYLLALIKNLSVSILGQKRNGYALFHMVFRHLSGALLLSMLCLASFWEVNSFLILILKHADDKVLHFFFVKDSVSVPINDVEVILELILRVLLVLVDHNLFDKDPGFVLVENTVLVNVKLIPDLPNENFCDANVFLIALR